VCLVNEPALLVLATWKIKLTTNLKYPIIEVNLVFDALIVVLDELQALDLLDIASNLSRRYSKLFDLLVHPFLASCNSCFHQLWQDAFQLAEAVVRIW